MTNPRYKIVPVEPIEEQHNAARDWSAATYGKPIGRDASRGCYVVMLKAAPDPSEALIEKMARAMFPEIFEDYIPAHDVEFASSMILKEQNEARAIARTAIDAIIQGE